MTNSLYEIRAARINAVRQIAGAATNGELTGEQRGQINRIDTEISRIDSLLNPRPKFEIPDYDGVQRGRRSSPEYRANYDTYLRRGDSALEHAERRALAADNDPAGGYLVPPEQTAEAVVKFVDDNLPVRQLATKLTLSGAASMGVPSIDSDVDDADWTTELTTGTEDAGLKFGKRELQPWPVIKRLRVSNKLLRRAKNADAIVNSRLAFKLLLTFEKAYLGGNGAYRPLGVFTASTTAALAPVAIFRAATRQPASAAMAWSMRCTSLKEGYLSRSPSLRWIFHRDAIKQIRLLKDGTTGMYLYDPADAVGQPDTILGVPVMLSEFVRRTRSRLANMSA